MINIPQAFNLCSPRSGNNVPNQIVVITNEGAFLQSYGTTIAYKPKGVFSQDTVYIDENYWDDSRTTKKYLNIWLESLGKPKANTTSQVTCCRVLQWKDLNP